MAPVQAKPVPNTCLKMGGISDQEQWHRFSSNRCQKYKGHRFEPVPLNRFIKIIKKKPAPYKPKKTLNLPHFLSRSSFSFSLLLLFLSPPSISLLCSPCFSFLAISFLRSHLLLSLFLFRSSQIILPFSLVSTTKGHHRRGEDHHQDQHPRPPRTPILGTCMCFLGFFFIFLYFEISGFN